MNQEKLERKRQFDRKCECDEWDFLAGVGPSAIREKVGHARELTDSCTAIVGCPETSVI